MTEKIFFDTDCLSSFLSVGYERIIVQLYRGGIYLPERVYDELSKIRYFPLRQKFQALMSSGNVTRMEITESSPESELYLKLIKNPDPGFKIIGFGEAAAIALAKCNHGILGSNNLRDILPYVDLYKIPYITTSDILVEALDNHLISEGQGNVIWRDMINNWRMMPCDSFSEYLKQIKKK